jgi:hypothetical protein
LGCADGTRPRKGILGRVPSAADATLQTVPFHVRITLVERSWTDELALDLTREQLEQRFLTPRREGRPITLNGRTFSWEAIERVRINETAETSTQLLPAIRAERAALPGIVLGIPDEWYVTDQGRDVTDDLITEPVGAAAPPTAAPSDGVFFEPPAGTVGCVTGRVGVGRGRRVRASRGR